jgi:hypothetical protein
MSPADSYVAERYRQAWLKLAAPELPPGVPFHVLGPRILRWWSPSHVHGVMFDRGMFEKVSIGLAEDGEKLITSFHGVTGVALSLRYRRGEIIRDEPCITFYVSEKQPRETLGRNLIPSKMHGLPTDVVEAGTPALSAVGPSHTPGSRLAPAQPGCSVSHHRVTTGTFGCLVEDDQQVVYILSCAHVLSDAAGAPGDAIVHPGTLYGGRPPADQIAAFTKAIPLTPNPCVGDAAIAEVSQASKVTSIIRHLGVKPARTRTLSGVGFFVQKSGDETNLTHGVVTGLAGTIGPYSTNGVSGIYFNNAIVTNGMSMGGDSGSLLMDYQAQAIGLLFGGLTIAAASGLTNVASWWNPIDGVLTHLGVHLP